jgi:hypothetical protein
MKALIICPARTHIDHRTQAAIASSGLPIYPLYEFSDLPRVRSALISKGLELGAERLIFIDADVVPTAEQLKWLAETDEVTPARAAWGFYPLRTRTTWSVRPKASETGRTEVKPEDSFEIEFGGLGLAAVHRESLLRIQAKLPAVVEGDVTWHPYCMPLVRNGEWLGDDRSLCWRLQKTGTRLDCYARLLAKHVFSAEFAQPDQ